MDRGPFGQGASRIRRMRVSLRLAITEPPTAALTHPCSQTQVQFHSSHSLSLPRFLCLLQLDSRFLIQPDSISWKLLVHSGENVSFLWTLSIRPSTHPPPIFLRGSKHHQRKPFKESKMLLKLEMFYWVYCPAN